MFCHSPAESQRRVTGSSQDGRSCISCCIPLRTIPKKEEPPHAGDHLAPLHRTPLHMHAAQNVQPPGQTAGLVFFFLEATSKASILFTGLGTLPKWLRLFFWFVFLLKPNPPKRVLPKKDEPHGRSHEFPRPKLRRAPGGCRVPRLGRAHGTPAAQTPRGERRGVRRQRLWAASFRGSLRGAAGGTLLNSVLENVLSRGFRSAGLCPPMGLP